MNPFSAGDVGEPRRSDDVPDRADPLHVRPVVRVDLDVPPLDRNADRFEAEVFDVPLNSDRHQDALGRQRLRRAVGQDFDAFEGRRH